MNPYYRPRRSMLYVPGCNTRDLHKARTLRVDSVILDLGDPILVEQKVESRRNVCEAALAGGYGRREVVVRVNDLQLEETAGQLRLVGADVGLRGLLRRVGAEGLVERARAMLAAGASAERDARAIVEALALATQGALMRQHADERAADAFCGARLEASVAHGFGTLGKGTDPGAILRRAAFE